MFYQHITKSPDAPSSVGGSPHFSLPRFVCPANSVFFSGSPPGTKFDVISSSSVTDGIRNLTAWVQQRGADFPCTDKQPGPWQSQAGAVAPDVTTPFCFSVSSPGLPHGPEMAAPPSASPLVPVRRKEKATEDRMTPLHQESNKHGCRNF